ncbi:RagB/SusD family nutrient uptake outer membrane protein [Marinilabilia sp.]|uniref:RagB/SusD family nutrient uptake outer membrane protein n=1 Tax=Marinilabilia sp. TaxID=2021252 RepID=UPI0025BA040A|nr:RagB/SusD family nutrient uptake outer membrane protein [Marinilabilia sp.]
MKYIVLILIAVLTIGIASCTDDYLETTATEFISADRMEEVGPYNPGTFDGLVRGIYSLMIQNGTGGTDLDHDDFGQKGYDIYLDLLSSDMALSGYNYGWYSDIARMTATTDNTNLANYKAWRYYYRIIFAANSVIDGLGGNDAELETAEEEYQMGQAKAMRAHSYFYLANLFAEDYEPSAMILPIYTDLEQESQPLSSAADVWTLIKNDLEESVVLLDGFNRGGELHSVNKDVATGILAYVYLTLGEYDNAAASASSLIENYSVIPIDKVAGGSDIPRNAYSYFDGDGADWIWGFDLTLDQGLDLVSWWGQVDYYTYSYAAAGDPKTMDAGLYASIPAEDVRSNQFVNAGIFYPLNKFYDENRSPMGQREVTSDYVYMRVEEMYLIKAEAEAFADDDVSARATLKSLLAERIGPTMIEDPENPEELIVGTTAEENLAYLDALSGDALKDEIYKQWRIEMWGEGKSYFAMKRNKATIVRQGHIDFDGVEIPYNDDRLTFDIPQQEIQDNPHITQP